MNWRCSDFIMWKSVLANSDFFHRCRQCKCYNYAYNVSAVMNFCWRAVNKWSAINVYTTRYMFFIGYLHVIFIFFFSIMWTHFNDVFPQKLFKVINFWKDLYVLVLLIVQRRVSQVYLRSYFIKLALWCSNACKHIEHHSNNMKNKILWTWDLLLLAGIIWPWSFFTYFYSSLIYEL